MKFSTKTRYGIRAMEEIGKHSLENKPILQKDISKKQGISVKYLDHIIHGLKAAGLIVNIGGKKSGYKITRKPSEITMLDIHNAFEPGICVIDCLAKGVQCSYDENCAAQGFWGGLNNIVVDYFKSFTLQDLIDNQNLIDDETASQVSG